MPGFLFVLFTLLPILSGVLWTPARSPGARFNFEDGTASRILLLTAHPDDEAFFFGPTLTSFMPKAHASTYTHHPEVYSLCISIGDADGIGAVRVEELGKSLDVFGIPAERRWVLDHTDLKDNIKAEWDPYLVADNVEKYVLSNNITTILTFDAFGVSAHPNHRSLFHAVSKLLSRPDLPTNLSAYGLITVPTSVKYLAILAPLQAKYDLLAARLANQFYVPIPVFVAGAHEWKTTAKAVFSHQSQLVWFRWLNMAFSRYLWVNEWTAIRPTQ